jgi:phage terminase large subunit GpA-like protein
MSTNPPIISPSILAAFFRGIKPDPILKVSEWADQYRFLPQESAEPGRFRMSRTPYNQEIADRLSVNDPSQCVVFMKSSQIGATETANNWLGYVIDAAPAPMLYVMPTDQMMKDTSKNRIMKMIEASPRVSAKIKPSKAKESGNTIQYKMFEGGFVKMVGANSPVGLASTPVRYVYLDEVDRYPMDVGGEGSAIKLATTRTLTFGARKKIFVTSTPTRKGTSAIQSLFDTTGQRYYHVPCPHCAAMQSLVFAQLRYERGKYDNVQYECAHCRTLIAEQYKTKMLADGKWIATHPEKEDGKTFGYHINALYSPYGMYSWADMAKENDDSEATIPDRITFINTKLGECYEEEGEVPQWENLYALREKYQKNLCMPGVAFITAGVDVQGDRLEVEIVGWMKGKESQSIDYRIIMGNSDKPETWDKLSALLNEQFSCGDGSAMPIAVMAVDSGYNTQFVYEFCLKHMYTGRVVPVKGRSQLSQIYSAPQAVQVTRAGQKVNSIKVFSVGVSVIKSELYGWLKLVPNDDKTYPAGYCHFPEYDQNYFKGLTSEKLEQTTNRKGYIEYQWKKGNFKRNEALDCRVYARAAAAIFGMDFFQEEHWSQVRVVINTDKPAAPKPKKKRDSIWDK